MKKVEDKKKIYDNVSPREMLDKKVNNLMQMEQDKNDIKPVWVVSIFILFVLTTIGAILQKNSSYLTSQTAYINGLNIHQYFSEIVQVKDFLSCGRTNFWFSGNALGYPMLISTSPLPTCLTALIMLLAERLLGITSLCFIRLFTISLVLSIPISWYSGCRQFGLTRTQSLFIGLSVLLCESQLQNGFELTEYLIEGNFAQLFSHLLFPLTVSKIYRRQFSDASDSPFHMLCLTYLCSIFAGVYCSLIMLVTHVAALITHQRGFRRDMQCFTVLHVKLGLSLSWMIIPFLLSYPYTGGETHTAFYGGFVLPDMLDMFASGALFDFNQAHCHVTVFVVLGVAACAINICTCVKQFSQKKRMHHIGLFSYWLLAVTVCTVMLCTNNRILTKVLNALPLNLNFNSRLFVIGLQSCGVVFVGMAIDKIALLPCYVPMMSEKSRRFVKLCTVLFVSLLLLKANADRVSDKTSILEPSGDFMEAIRQVRDDEGESGNGGVQGGRILSNTRLGSGGSWDMFNIPLQTGKPGAMSVLKGWHSSLSTFYVDSIPFGSVDVKDLKQILRLYNIHYLVLSSAFMDPGVYDSAHFQTVARADEMVFLKVVHDWPGSGYVEFARLPGYIDGNLKNIREAVLETLPLYASNVLLYVNPRQGSEVRKKDMFNVKVMKISPSNDVSLVTWKLNNEGMHSEQVIDDVRYMFDEDEDLEEEEIRSSVVEELNDGVEYHALVEVADGDESKVVLKVSYHPFWRCVYFPVSPTYEMPTKAEVLVVPRNRTSILVDHVTPNFMSVTLPPGRYHVIFRYRFPGILKIMAAVFAVVFLNGWLNLRLFARVWRLLTTAYGRLETFQRYLLFAFISLVNLLYYRSVEMDVEPVVRRLSIVSEFKANLTYRPSRLRQFSSLIFNQCKERVKESRQSLMRIIQRNYKRKEERIEKVEEAKKCFLEDGCVKASTEKKRQSPPIPEVIKSSPDRSAELFFYDHDSSFSYDGLVYRSPPTPPKHTKKSYRKRHSKAHHNGGESHSSRRSTPVSATGKQREEEQQMSKSSTTKNKSVSEEEESEFFQTSPGRRTSPGLGNIIDSLRRNSSPDRDENESKSPRRIEKYVPRIDLAMYSKRPEKPADENNDTQVSPRRDTLMPEMSLQYPRSPRKDTLVPNNVSPGECKTLDDLYRLENNNYYKKVVARRESGCSPRSVGSGDADWEWDGMVFESYSGGHLPPSSSSPSSEIDIDYIVSRAALGGDEEVGGDMDDKVDLYENKSSDLSMEEESFSPRSSSSPEPSLSSPEQFTTSPDGGHSSPDNSFEFISGKNLESEANCTSSATGARNEHGIDPEVYRIYLPDSPKGADPIQRRHTVSASSESRKGTMESPERRTNYSTHAADDGVERSPPHTPHQVRRKRYSIPLES